MTKKWTFVIIGVIALGIAAYGCSGTQATSENLKTERISRGSLEAEVDATGVVYPNQSAIIPWETSGIVEEVVVKQGDQVSAGRTLAVLKGSSLPQNIIQAEQELINAQQALEDLFDNAELAAAKAELELAKARQDLEDAEYKWAIKQPRSASSEELKKAKAELTIAEKRLENKRKRLDNASGKIAKAQAQIQLTNAINQFQSAVWYLNLLQEGADETDMAVYESEWDVAEAKYEMADEEYERVKDGPTADDIALAEARVEAAQAALEKISLEAPFAGTVTDVEIKEGDLVSAGTRAFRIDDLQRLFVDVEVSEVDINQIATGQRVRLTFDAVSDKEYQGNVIEISPVGLKEQGLVTFTVTVELENPDNEIKPGMTAAVSFVVNHVEDALLVPNRSIRWVDDKQVVYLAPSREASSANLEKVQVELGASSDEYSEVLAGDVKEGDLVVLNPPTEIEQPQMGPGREGDPFE